MEAPYEGRSSERIMSITYSTSNERNMILERALMGFLSLMLISVGKAVIKEEREDKKGRKKEKMESRT